MRTTRLRWIGALLSCLGCALLVATPTGAFAAEQGHATFGKKPAHPQGFYVEGQGRLTKYATASSLVRDGSGGQHVVTSVPSSTTPGEARLDYLTRKPGTTNWVSHVVPGLRPSAGQIQVETHLSTDGHTVYAVVYECDGVFVASVSINAVRLPEPTLVGPAFNTCSTPVATTDNPPVAQAAAIPYDQLGVLRPDPAQDNEIAIWGGSPKTGFTPGTALPTANNFVPVQMASSPAGRVVVVGTGSDGTNEGIYVVTEARYQNTWAGPTKIATLNSPTSDYNIEAVTAYGASTWVGLSRPVVAGTHPAHTLFVNHGNASGWDGVFHLVHSTPQDHSLRLVYNNDTGHLHAAYTRIDPASKVKNSGVMEQSLVNKWSKPKFVSHWYRDYAQQLTFNAAGFTVVSYAQR